YPRFSYILLVWFIFGLANLLAFPLRIVYLAEEGRGLGLRPETVILLTGILPAISKLVSSYFWGMLFDKINFILLRIILNIFIGIGIFMFFFTANLHLIGLSVIITYIGFGGTPLVWNLWVTKIVPADRVQECMALHSFFTGVRGILGPVIGFSALAVVPIRSIGMFTGIIFWASIFMMMPLLRKGKSASG
ncbi:MAG: hypothetical protein JW874_08650, partial [Spirochaetales bacterium]|nr:hypothetical protein [Spirochaetales bacterium]